MIERIDNMDQQYGIKVSDAAVEITGNRLNNLDMAIIETSQEQQQQE